MTIRCIRLAVLLLAALLLPSARAFGAGQPDRTPSVNPYGPPPGRLAALRRGINLTNWFRFPPRADPASLRIYLSDPAIDALSRVGFTFVRLAVEPAVADTEAARILLRTQLLRLQRHGLAVVIALHPRDWQLESRPTDRAALFSFWARIAPALRALDPRLTFPELLNEPVFPHDADGWATLQDRLRRQVRAVLPADTIVLTGNDWGSIGGLQDLTPSADANVIYSFHFYDPVELTSLAAWRAGLDRSALARLPFPAPDPLACDAALGSTDPVTTGVGRFYCDQDWTEAAVAQRIAAAARWAGQHRVALLLGEFGATARLNRTARLAWLEAVRRACEATRIGWALWGYDDAMGFDLPRPPPLRPILDAALLRALGLAQDKLQINPIK